MPTQIPLDAKRVADIATAIHTACAPVIGANRDRADAVEAANEATTKAVNARETVLVLLAGLSGSGGWTDQEVRAAAASAARMSNNASDKALATFIGETKRAMHPRVRDHVPALVSLRDAVWDDEAAGRVLDKNAPTPCRKAFARKYHMMISLFGEAENGRVFTHPAEVLVFARSRDPDMDPAKVASRLDKIRAELASIYGVFRLDDLQVAMQALDDVGEVELAKVFEPLTEPEPVIAQAPTVVSLPTPVVSQTAAAPVSAGTEEGFSSSAPGAVDIFDELLAA